MKKPEISVIIPMYNSSKTIADCLSAVLRSDYKDFEIIVVDDYSKDNSVDIVKKFPVRLIKSKKNAGAGASRNIGAKKAKGNILLFVDGDVIINKGDIEFIAEDFEKNPEISVVQGLYSLTCRYKNFGSKYSTLSYYFYGITTKDKLLSTVVTNFVAVRKKVFVYVGGFDLDVRGRTTVGEDQMFGHKLDRVGFKILLDKRIKVEHYKYYSTWKYLTHDMQTGSFQIQYMLRNKYRFVSKAIKKNKVGVLIPSTFVYSVALSPVILFLLFLSLFFESLLTLLIFIVVVLFFYLINIRFLLFTLRQEGEGFFIWAVIVTYLRMLFAFTGGLIGVFEFFFLPEGMGIIRK